MSEQNNPKCMCIVIVILSLTSIASIAALIIITTVHPTVKQDAHQSVTIGDITEIHSQSQNFGLMTSVVQGMSLFFLGLIISGVKHFIIDRRNHQVTHGKFEILEDGIKGIMRNMKK